MATTTAPTTAKKSRRKAPKLSVGVWIGISILAVLVLAAIFAPLITPYDPHEPFPELNSPPSSAHPLGTTGQGYDVLSQFVYGARTSLFVSFAVAVLTTIVALAVGLSAAYFRGVTDQILTLIANVFLVIPSLPLIVVLAAFLPTGPVTIVLVLTLTGWAFGARLFRSQALSLREREFVTAAVAERESRWRIIGVEILPNMWSIVAAYFVNQVIFAIGAEASLEFLGLGDGSVVTWGIMLFWAQNSQALLMGSWWTFVVPGLGIAFTAFSLALINFAIDERSNPRLRAYTLLERLMGSHIASAALITPVVRKKKRP